MRIAVPHHTTKEKARAVLEQKIDALLRQFGGQADDLQHSWSGDTLTFKGKAKGFSLKGTLDVTEKEAILDAKLPLLAMAFEPKIAASVKKGAEALFRTA